MQKPARRLPWALLAGLAGAIIAVVLFAWLASEVLQLDTLSFDNKVRTSIHQYASPPLTTLVELVTRLGSAWVLVPLGALVVAGFWRSGHRREAVAFAVIMVGAVLIQFLLKLAFHRVRPLPFFGPALQTYSFPSGHALNSICFYGALAAFLAQSLRSWWQRVGLAVAAATLVLLIGVSRVYLGVHYPSDVVGGYLAGVVWLSAVGLAFREIPGWFPFRRDISGLAAGRAPD